MFPFDVQFAFSAHLFGFSAYLLLIFKGSLTLDFRLQVFFMNLCPPGPQVFQWGRFEFFQKFAEIFANECLSPVSTTPVINCSAVSTTPAINPCHEFSVIPGVVDTSDEFITGVVVTNDKFIAGVSPRADLEIINS
jgi:hypothetical protein